MEKKKGLLVISFGTSYEQTRKVTIEAIENDLKTAFPDRAFYRAWTSGFIRKKIAERDGLIIPSIDEAMEKLISDGITDVIIQATLILSGGEFKKISAAAEKYKDRVNISVGRALIENDEDVSVMTDVIFNMFGETVGDGMMVLMGHGSEDSEFPVYEKMNESFEKKGLERYCVGTVEFLPGIEPVLAKAEKLKPGTVYLTPFLIVAGDHALNDMAGEDEDSWKNQIAAKGANVKCIIKGLGEYKEIRDLFVQKAREAI